MSKFKGLGKNFDSLVPMGVDVQFVASAAEQKIHYLKLNVILPKKDQPRQNFVDAELEQLAQSIAEQGILQPILVTPSEQDMYTIIAGERRWRAASKAGLSEIPAIIRQVDELKHFEQSVIENIQRSDLNALEVAKSISRLHNEFSQSYEQIAKRLGKAYTTVINSTRLLQLPMVVQESIINGTLSEGHGRALLALSKNPAAQNKLYLQVMGQGLSVRQTETLAAEYKRQTITKRAPENSKTTARPINPQSLINPTQLSAKLGAKKVELKSTKLGGKIVISYVGEEQLAKIAQTLGKL